MSTETTTDNHFTSKLDESLEALERLSLGLPTEDENGNPFPRRIRSDEEREVLLEVGRLKRELHYAEIQKLLDEVEHSCEMLDLMESYERRGFRIRIR
jgi:hypothetical protein